MRQRGINTLHNTVLATPERWMDPPSEADQFAQYNQMKNRYNLLSAVDHNSSRGDDRYSPIDSEDLVLFQKVNLVCLLMESHPQFLEKVENNLCHPNLQLSRNQILQDQISTPYAKEYAEYLAESGQAGL